MMQIQRSEIDELRTAITRISKQLDRIEYGAAADHARNEQLAGTVTTIVSLEFKELLHSEAVEVATITLRMSNTLVPYRTIVFTGTGSQTHATNIARSMGWKPKHEHVHDSQVYASGGGHINGLVVGSTKSSRDPF